MDHWYLMKILWSKKSLKLLLNRNLCFSSKQSLPKTTGGCFTPSSSNSQKSTVCFKHLQNILAERQALLRHLAVRKFSSTKTVFSNGGSNRDAEKRQVRILYLSLGLAVLFYIYAALTIEDHQDYVIITPEDKK